MPKVYLIGPTVGLSRLNLDTFEKVAEKARLKGLQAVIPHKLFADEENEPGNLSTEEAIERRAEALAKCDYAVLIPGFYDDYFACRERLVAKTLGIEAIHFHNLPKRF